MRTITLDVTIIETLHAFAAANPIGALFAATAIYGAVLWMWK